MNEPTFFPTQALFRQWLENNHTNKTELIVGFYKVKIGRSCVVFWLDRRC